MADRDVRDTLVVNNWDERVLIISPHADDETIGCGGLLGSGKITAARVFVAAVEPETSEIRKQELKNALHTLDPKIECKVFSNLVARLSDNFYGLVSAIDEELSTFQPTAVFAPYASHHQDHKTVYDATLAALRQRPSIRGIKLVALFEYPYIESWPPPNIHGGKFYFPLTDDQIRKKSDAISKYETQTIKDKWICGADAMGRWAARRGEEIGEKYAEVFYLLRGILA